MGATILGGIIALFLVAANGLVVFLNSRNDRALMSQEVDILKKLDPNTDTAKKLREVINARVTRWHRKALKQKKRKNKSGEMAEADLVRLVDLSGFSTELLITIGGGVALAGVLFAMMALFGSK